jgi:hypothetical protein
MNVKEVQYICIEFIEAIKSFMLSLSADSVARKSPYEQNKPIMILL